MLTYDAVVIGAGVIGSAVTLELQRGGRSVLCLDKGPSAGSGSTSSSSAIVRFSYSTHDAVLASWEASHLWFDWADHLGVADPDGMVKFIKTGALVFLTTSYDGEVGLAIWDELEVPYERLSTEQVNERWPWLDTGKYYPPKPIDDPAFADDATEQLDAYYQPGSGFIDDPMLSAKNLAYAARHYGADFQFNSEVVSIDQVDGMVTGVTLASGETIKAGVVVNVGGPHANAINHMAGVADEMKIGHRPLRQEVFSAAGPEGVTLADGMPMVADLDVGQYFRPQPGGQILVGGTEPECDELQWLDDANDITPYTTVEAWETAMLRIARRVPEFGIPLAPRGLASAYDASDDWVPIYDKSSLDGFFMACGSSGNQFKNAPIAGLFMRTLIDAVVSGRDHDADPVQYRGPVTGRDINLGAFSRLREPSKTSGTVMG
jgi:sarcosine oxidase subunit beta